MARCGTRVSVASVAHLPAEQLGDEDRLVARWARPGEAERAAEAVAVGAAALAEGALAAQRAFVDGVGDPFAQTGELGGEGGEVRVGRAGLAEPVGALLAGVGAVAGAGGGDRCSADRAVPAAGRHRW